MVSLYEQYWLFRYNTVHTLVLEFQICHLLSCTIIAGLLERPPLAGHIEEVKYKIYVAGKTGVGKSCTVAKLTGHDIPKTHMETPGMLPL